MTAIDPRQIGGNCRFYEKEFPELEECVTVQVQQIAEMGAYVKVSAAVRQGRTASLACTPPYCCAIHAVHGLTRAPSHPRSCWSTTTSRA